MIPNWMDWVQVIPLIIQDQFYTIQNLQRSPIPQTSNWSGTVSYSKPALKINSFFPLYLMQMLLSYPLWCRSFFANEYHNGAEIILNSHFLTKKIYMLPHNKFVPIVSVFSFFFYFFQTLLITLIRLSSGTFAQKKSWFLYYSLHCKPKYFLLI